MDQNGNGNRASGFRLRHCGSFDKARQLAHEASLVHLGMVFPGMAFRQGDRYFFMTAMGFPTLVKMTKTDPARKGEDPAEHRERPCDKGHWHDIAGYLTGVDRYILPPFVVNTDTPLIFYSAANEEDGVGIPGFGATLPGFVNVPNDAMFWMQDGQHRREAASTLIGPGGRLLKDGAAVVIAVESELDQIQQDFADCATVKPISPALLATYNRRDAFSKFIRDVVAGVPIFKGRIEKVMKTIGKNSEMLFTTNNIRQAFAMMLTGSRQTAGKIGEVTSTLKPFVEDNRSDSLNRLTGFFNNFTANNPQWSSVAQQAVGSGVVPKLRPNYVHFSATGILLMAEIANDIWAEKPQEANALFTALAVLDWSRSSKLWEDNVVQDGSTLNQSRSLLAKAINNIRTALGLPVKDVKKAMHN